MSPLQNDIHKSPPAIHELLQRLTEVACYAP